MPNQPIPFKEHSTNPKPDPKREGEPGRARPPGEVGGHTVQPWEQSGVPATTSPNSKDVPPPEVGAREANVAGTGPGAKTTEAPGNLPSGKDVSRPTQAPPLSTAGQEGGAPAGVPAGPSTASTASAASTASPGQSRPPRPPVYSPQSGHEPAPRPPPSHLPASGLGTEGDRLVEAIVKAISDNIGKAFHQSVAQAVREAMPLSARTVDRGTPAGAPSSSATRPVPAFTQASTAAGTAGGKTPPRAGQGETRSGSTASVGGRTGVGAGARGTADTGPGAMRRNDAGTGQHGPASGAATEGGPASGSPGPTGSSPTGREPEFQAGSGKSVDPTKGTPPTNASGSSGQKPTDASAAAGHDDGPAESGEDVGGRTGPMRSQYGGTIEPPVPVPSDKEPPGNAAAASADEQTRQGKLA